MKTKNKKENIWKDKNVRTWRVKQSKNNIYKYTNVLYEDIPTKSFLHNHIPWNKRITSNTNVEQFHSCGKKSISKFRTDETEQIRSFEKSHLSNKEKTHHILHKRGHCATHFPCLFCGTNVKYGHLQIKINGKSSGHKLDVHEQE